MITVLKSERLLILTDATRKTLFSCPVCLGSSPVGSKELEGDGKTPEGSYRICSVNGQSKFHLALGISYPNAADAKKALASRRISLFTYLRICVCERLNLRPPWKSALGGFVMIHGEHPEKKTGDWTAGCIAVTDSDIDTIASLTKIGDRIVIKP